MKGIKLQRKNKGLARMLSRQTFQNILHFLFGSEQLGWATISTIEQNGIIPISSDPQFRLAAPIHFLGRYEGHRPTCVDRGRMFPSQR
jgi:hypothetical protein